VVLTLSSYCCCVCCACWMLSLALFNIVCVVFFVVVLVAMGDFIFSILFSISAMLSWDMWFPFSL